MFHSHGIWSHYPAIVRIEAEVFTFAFQAYFCGICAAFVVSIITEMSLLLTMASGTDHWASNTGQAPPPAEPETGMGAFYSATNESVTHVQARSLGLYLFIRWSTLLILYLHQLLWVGPFLALNSHPHHSIGKSFNDTRVCCGMSRIWMPVNLWGVSLKSRPPKNVYAWKLVLSRPWHPFEDLQGYLSFEGAYYHLLNA
jgi:hypothetical protein